MECHTCKSLSGELPLFPESKMYEGKYWVVEHGYPVSLKGWLIIILKRHAAALHELTQVENEELGELLAALPKILHDVVGSEKEYVMCFAEAEHFQHIHWHVVAKPSNLLAESKGPHIFDYLNSKHIPAIDKQELIEFCEVMKLRLVK